jgi:hypothetical protein
MLPLRHVEMKLDIREDRVVVRLPLPEPFDGLTESGEYGPDGFVQGKIGNEPLSSGLEEVLRLDWEMRQCLFCLASTQLISVTFTLEAGARELVVDLPGYIIPEDFSEDDVRQDIATYLQMEEDLISV